MSQNQQHADEPVAKLTYNLREACRALGISPTTLWRLEKRGALRAVKGIRHKLYSIAALKQFVEKGIDV